ncbi:MAG: Na/Pi cotransporter family protein [Gemella sp.]|nr:Na/Pi cotransporter family protein [Gemella sp.]
MSEMWQDILFTFFGGLGLFLFSMKYLGDGLQLMSGDKMRNLLDKYTSTPLKAVLVGTFVTCLIQSSSGTTVIVVSLVAAGLLKLKQAIGVVMGANIGTTITSFIIGIPVSDYALPAIFVGACLLFFVKKKSVNNFGRILFSLGGIFYSLKLMSGAMKPLQKMDWFMDSMQGLDGSPLMGILVGTGLTVIVQSSSATIAILQNIYADGAITLTGALPVLFGDNIGTTITAVLATLGSTIAAKRVAASHVMFNVIGTVICMILIVPFTMYVEYASGLLGLNPKLQIAWAHGSFNIFNTIIQFPFIWLLASIVTKIVPGEEEIIKHRTSLEPALITSAPAVALGQVRREVISMTALSKKSLANATSYLVSKEPTLQEKGHTYEEAINNIDVEITEYLTKLFREKLTDKEGVEASNYLDTTRDIERVGDHARDIILAVDYQIKKGVDFTDVAKKDIEVINEHALKMIELTIKALEEDDNIIASEAMAICDKVAELKNSARKSHEQRMKDGTCDIKAGVLYLDLLAHYMRVCEHMRNVLEKKLTGQI